MGETTRQYGQQANSTALPKYSILQVKGNFVVNDVSGRKVLLFREAPRILYTGLSQRIGNPREYEKNVSDAGDSFFSLDKAETLLVPLDETNEWVAQ